MWRGASSGKLQLSSPRVRGEAPALTNNQISAGEGRFNALRLAEAPPHPDLLHSPS